eukprot:NODE_32_length_32166_cov_0.707737.p15 type:complete len:156 gc:universal NODE_32_length_32166_cov_0.707737:23010-22543(-)
MHTLEINLNKLIPRCSANCLHWSFSCSLKSKSCINLTFLRCNELKSKDRPTNSNNNCGVLAPCADSSLVIVCIRCSNSFVADESPFFPLIILKSELLSSSDTLCLVKSAMKLSMSDSTYPNSINSFFKISMIGEISGFDNFIIQSNSMISLVYTE